VAHSIVDIPQGTKANEVGAEVLHAISMDVCPEMKPKCPYGMTTCTSLKHMLSSPLAAIEVVE
jgi:hypothetical protein